MLYFMVLYSVIMLTAHPFIAYNILCFYNMISKLYITKFIKLGSEPDIKYTWVGLCDFRTNYINIVTLYTWGWEPLRSDFSLILSISLRLHISNAKFISPQLV